MEENEVFKVPQRPWFIPKSLPGKLFQAWMILFFILTWACVKKYIFVGPGLVGPLPAPLFWIWFLDFCTVIVFFVLYSKYYKGAAEKVDARVKQWDVQNTQKIKGGVS